MAINEQPPPYTLQLPTGMLQQAQFQAQQSRLQTNVHSLHDTRGTFKSYGASMRPERPYPPPTTPSSLKESPQGITRSERNTDGAADEESNRIWLFPSTEIDSRIAQKATKALRNTVGRASPEHERQVAGCSLLHSALSQYPAETHQKVARLGKPAITISRGSEPAQVNSSGQGISSEASAAPTAMCLGRSAKQMSASTR